ncbi:VCBS repeat-containing protein [Algoriphagus sp. NBT04N3]|jgi:enediyne biosynthesis protein E4|uniref:VCBS repeat-containing protein n=1 Tax=Algoriphagus sp. NBT04N3 TaxID=2705473 RepID=UPI001C630233|nr:VCBS repeat-containing protein [Algoriphagus sp. NBT04N3]QYH38148.1 VCBS repeat-containing protein [Algoriphagus sp. NBT04N3]
MSTNNSKIFSKSLFWMLMGLCLLSISVHAQENFEAKYQQLKASKSKVNFKNQLTEDQYNNILRYEYFYNGGGVAVGDLDNDGLDDIFFTGNMVSNRLYKNLGGLKFEDLTKSAGIGGKNSWATGVSMVDINADGLLDIYVSYSGKGDEQSRKNELWINLGGFKFEEKAEEYGIADPSNSTQALFFDFDRDGDLDLYLLNHHIQVINELEFDEVKLLRHPTAGDKLYRNDNGKFTDISQSAGIKGSALGFGLAVIASDINGDGWTDLLVTNDYIEPDYLYINQKDGTFKDELTTYFQHISHFSMGADIADINNDGLKDIYTLDMLPEDNRRQKLLYGPENYEQYALMIKKGFYHQNMRNMLQLNLGNGNFSEVGQLAEISNTDWSWSALFFDATNNGFKDLMVTNGYFRDYTNRDFLKYKGDYYFKQAVANQKADTLHLVTSMSSTPISNYFFQNLGDLNFKNRSNDWGFEEKGFSSGAAYSDLDNDGDLDLIVSNLNETAGIFENTGKKGNWIQFQLQGPELNPFGLGSEIKVFSKGSQQIQEHQVVRGFQSSSTYRVHFGLGENSIVDSVLISWPDGKVETIQNPKVNSINTLSYSNAITPHPKAAISKTFFSKVEKLPDFKPKPTGFNDFKRQPLMTVMPGAISPVLAKGDLNQDGIPEIFIGGTKGQSGMIFSFDGSTWSNYTGFRSSDEYTDAVAIFEDFNADGWLDLFIGSGGYHDYLSSDEALQDRLYLNDGTGKLSLQKNFPAYTLSTGTAQALDINQDGFLDLFVGGKVIPGRYPEIPFSKVLINNGSGGFSDQTDQYLPQNGKLGLIQTSINLDLNEDGFPDLVIAGEFMPITVLINQQGKIFRNQTDEYFEDNRSGWWTALHATDLDDDGDLDIIAGNFGNNSQFKVNDEKKLRLYASDFDQNGSIDPILECYIGDEAYPFASRDELLDQMVSMRSKFTTYESYADAKLQDLFSQKDLEAAQILEANSLSSYVFENTGTGFIAKKLPTLAQAFPIFQIQTGDFDQDGYTDLLLGGNQRQTRIRIGNIDAGLGLVLKGNGKGDFQTTYPTESGLAIKGDIKSILSIEVAGKKFLLFGIHGQALELYQYHEK